ncbi:MAG: hypothetical protein ACI4WR_03910, partial [Bulleidia sp.]
SIEMTKNDNVIILTAPTVNARALYVNPQCIEILAGTTMKAYGPQEMKSMRSLFRDMSEKGILSETETGRIQFEKNYRFHDLNTAAQFLLHRGGDNTAMWTRENGSPLTEAKPAGEKAEGKAPAKKQHQNAGSSSQRTHSGNKSSEKKETKPSEQKKDQNRKPAAKKQGQTKKSAGAQQSQNRKNHSSGQKKNHQSHSGNHNQKTQPAKQAEHRNQEQSGNSQPKKKKSYRRQTMADKMDIKPQKVTPQVKEAEKSSNGFFSNILARFRH